jgi:hypothetical protein
MIVFENEGQIDPRLVMLIGVNVKGSASVIGYFGTGLKYAIACMMRWGEDIKIQSGAAEFTFTVEQTEIRGAEFGLITMNSRYDKAQLGFTTALGKNWEPWMVYRELWCNAQDEPRHLVYETDVMPKPTAGSTRVIVSGKKIEAAHNAKNDFILDVVTRQPLNKVQGLELYEGRGEHIFYRGIAVQKLERPSLYTYNITEFLWLTEDRTAGSWATDPIIARNLTLIEGSPVIDSTIVAPSSVYESRLDYSGVKQPGEHWRQTAQYFVEERPLDVPRSVREMFADAEVELCPSCGRPLED